MSIGQVVGRVLAVIGGLLLIGIVLRLIVAILSPVLPEWFLAALTGGWWTLFGILSPAMAPIMALAILIAIVWVVVGKRW
jgi:hypothetical protein